MAVKKIGCLNKSMNFLLHVVTVSYRLSVLSFPGPMGNLKGIIDLLC